MLSFRGFEIFLFVLCNFTLYLWMTIYPFRDRLRFGKATTYVWVFLGTLLYFAKEWMVEMHGLSHVASTLITALTGLITIYILIKDRYGKSVMMLVLVMNLSIIPLYLGKFTEGLLFYENSLQLNRWSYSLCILIWEIPLALLIARYMNNVLVPAMTVKYEGDIWNYLWIVPTTFFAIWNVYLGQFPYFAAAPIHERFSSLLMILLISGGSFIIYHVTFSLLNEKVKNETYESQYKRLNSKISEARKARHDMRHHLVMIDSYLNDNKIDELKEYLSDYKNSLPMEEALTFCDHYAANAILTYTKQQANMLQAECNIKVNFPSEMSVSNQDLTIIMGNLLENALDACRRDLELQSKYQPVIEVTGKYDGNIFLLRIKNTSLQVAEKNQEKDFISSKRSGDEGGIGINSVKSIVKKYKGTFQVDQEDGWFSTSIMIMNKNK